MSLSFSQKNRLIEKNRLEYSEAYDSLRFITKNETETAVRERDEILSALRGRAVFCCRDTKVDGRNLSRGCEICTQGKWSCLFVNGRCNCRCFYCPTGQDLTGVPTTNTVPFPKVGDYVDYIRKLGFTGVSFSGGEPLLTLDTTLEYLRAVKDAFGGNVYTWLYTNGTLATRDTLMQLKTAGLDEIRFDIGATGLNLDAARQAADIVDVITVEIPAIPEEFEVMKKKIVEMQKAGIHHLNLHQLRLTPHNLPHVNQRGYTFLHGERVTVLESELTALRLIRWAQEEGIPLPINYCSFVYKNRFQRAAARRKSAEFIRKPHEDITGNGYIRTLEITGAPDALNRIINGWKAEGKEECLWALSPNKDRLQVSFSLWHTPELESFPMRVGYTEAKILPALTGRNLFVQLPLNPQRHLFVEKVPAHDKIDLRPELFDRLRSIENGKDTDINSLADDPDWESVRTFETIESGLAEYF